MARFEPNVLAALGAYQFRFKSLVGGSGLEQDPGSFVASAVESGTVRCRISPDQLSRVQLGLHDRNALGESWQSVASGHSAPMRGLRVGLEAYSSEGITGLCNELARASGVETVFVADTSLAKTGNWHWPLQIGFLPDSASRRLRAQTTDSYPHGQLIRVVELGTDAGSCDLLVVPSLESLAPIAGRGIEIGSVVSLDGKPGPPLAALRALARRLGVSALGTVNNAASLANSTGYFRTFLDELSHNHPLDVALRKATGDPLSYQLLAHPSYLERTRVTSALQDIVASIRVAAREQRIESAEATSSLGVMEDLDQKLKNVGFLSEEGGGTEGVHAVGRVQPTLKKIEPKKGARYLQAQVFEEDAGSWSRRRESFRAGAAHQIRVRVGPGDVDWAQVDTSLDESNLDPNDAMHTVEVLLIAQPHAAAGPLTAVTSIESIRLPAIGGPSTLARFEIDVHKDAERLEATVQLLYKNREIQTATLSGEVVDRIDAALGSSSVTAADDGSRIRFLPSLPANVDYRLDDPADLYLRRDSDSVVVLERDSAPFFVPLSGISRFDDKIREKLYDAAYGIAQLGTGIDTPPGLDLMRLLAAQGRFLRDKLLAGVADVEAIRTVRVSSPSSGHSLSAELFYDGPAPDDDAAVCPAFLSARGDQVCSNCRASSGAWICPRLFWGLNRIIERQVSAGRAFAGRGAANAAPEPSLEHQLLGRPRRILLAASNNMNAVDRKETLLELRKIDPKVKEAGSWSDWSQWGLTNKPTLLVALPHNVETATGFEALEIGVSARLRLDKIGEGAYFSFDRAKPGPITLLLGCNTSAADIAYQDFVAEARSNGASVVVGTLTTVLGRFAAPVARELACLLVDPEVVGDASLPSRSVSIGEILRRARVRLMRAGNPMALAVVVYGDSRWRLAA